MRIVQYGCLKPREIKCNHCGSILEYVPIDLKESPRGHYLACPVYGLRIYTDNELNKFTKE